MKKVPAYWWDFGKDGEIIVESDSDKFPIVGRFPYNPRDGLGCAANAIAEAEAMVQNLRAGRATPRPR